MSYSQEPESCSRKKIKVSLNLSNYVTKSNVINTTGADISDLTGRTDLASSQLKIRCRYKVPTLFLMFFRRFRNIFHSFWGIVLLIEQETFRKLFIF